MTENQTHELPEEFTACTAPGLACENPAHDHTAGDEDEQTADGQRLCNDCLAPCHWDEAGDYQHDDSNTPACFLIQSHVPTVPAIGTRVYVHSRDPKGKGDTTGTVVRYISGPDRPGVTLVIHFDKHAGDGIAMNYPEQCNVLGGLDSAAVDTVIRVHNAGTYRKTATNEWVRNTKAATSLTSAELLELMVKESV
jgi:hypothetical protein